MIQLDTMSSRSELILLYRLDLTSRYFLLDLPMRDEIELNLKSTHLKLLRSFEDPGLLRCRDSSGSLFNLGVMLFSKSAFGGDITMSDIGYRPKKDFLAATQRAGGGETILVEYRGVKSLSFMNLGREEDSCF